MLLMNLSVWESCRVTLRLPTIKALFAEATHCAYPGCAEPLVFEDAGRGVRTIAVQIAHIRSAKPDGPRHDPEYPVDKVNEEENLLLLCGKHHPAVDQNESTFTTEELERWKAAQVAQAGGTVVDDADISRHVRSLESSIEAVLSILRPSVAVEAVGGQMVDGALISVPLPALSSIHIDDRATLGERVLSVQVTNSSAVGIDVTGSGLDVDLGDLSDAHVRWLLTGGSLNHAYPCRLDGRSTRQWHVPMESVRITLAGLPSVHRLRGFASLGDGSEVFGDWGDLEVVFEAVR